MSENLKKNALSSVTNFFIVPSMLFFVEVILIVWKITDDLIKGYAFDSWNVTELLINYEGGFVRRGLLGEIIYGTHHFFSISPYQFVLAICLFCIILYFYLFFKGFQRKKLSLFIAASVLLIAAPVFSGDWVRKDVMMVIFFILCLKTQYSGRKWATLLACVLLSIGILVHESLFFLAFPALVFLNIIENKASSTLFTKLTPLFIPLLTFFSVCIFGGNQEVANNILDSWNIKDKTVENAITSLSWNLEFGIRIAFAQGKAFTDNGLIFPPLVWLIVMSSVFYLLVNLPIFQNNKEKILKYRKFMFAPTIFQLVSIAPLFIFGCDYGRWIFYWSSTSVAAFLFIPEKTMDMMNNCITIKDSFFTKSSIFASSKAGLYILFIVLGIPGFIMNTSNYLNSTIIYQFILRISSVLNYFI